MTINKFRLSGKHFIITYKGHIELKALKYLFRHESVHIIFHEIGKTGYKHTHVVCCFMKKYESRNVKCFDIDGVHPNIKPIRTRAHWTRCVEYYNGVKKNDAEGVNIISNTLTGYEFEWLGSTRQVIQNHKTWNDVINDDYLATSLQNYPHWCRECFDNKPNSYKFDLMETYGSLLPWQSEVLTRLETQSKRKVTWIYDEKGGNGKSELSDHLEDQKNAYIVESGNYKDIAYLWQKQETVVFDLVRSSEDFTPYRAIEAFLKGRITSTKYKPVRKRLNHNRGCNIVVFANYLPDKSSLSLDRWDIGHLNTGAIVWSNEKLPLESLNIKGETLDLNIPTKKNGVLNLKIPSFSEFRKTKKQAIVIPSEESSEDWTSIDTNVTTVPSVSIGALRVNVLSQHPSHRPKWPP